MKRNIFTRLIYILPIFFCVSYNIYIATDINKLKYLTTLTNIEYIAMAQYENQWDASIAAGRIVFGTGGEATFQDSFAEFWSNGFMRDEWGEFVDCPNSSSKSNSYSVNHSSNGSYGNMSAGNSSNASYSNSNSQNSSNGQKYVVCHNGGSANCDESSCY